MAVLLTPSLAPPSAPAAVSTDVSAGDWNRYLEGHPDATVDHLWHWRQVFEEVFGHRSAYLAARRGSQIVGVLPLVLFRSRLFGRSVISVPFLNYGGLVTDDAEVAAALVDRARGIAQDFGASHLELRHVRQQLEDLPCRRHKIALTRSLPAAGDALWADTDRKVRNQVRKAQKEGLVCEEGGVELVEAFYPVFARNMRDLGTPVYSRRLFQTTLTLFGERARVFLVKLGGRPLAGAVAITFRNTVLVPWASSLREFRHLCPNMLLYWTMLDRAVSQGARTFDFGRSSPGSGTHQFKLQWGASETPLAWEYLLLTRAAAPDHGPANPRFARAIDVWKRLPVGVANALGPVIVRNIP
jgi:FemAB-related protein (PEP-CTERM system-associated)